MEKTYIGRILYWNGPTKFEFEFISILLWLLWLPTSILTFYGGKNVIPWLNNQLTSILTDSIFGPTQNMLFVRVKMPIEIWEKKSETEEPGLESKVVKSHHKTYSGHPRLMSFFTYKNKTMSAFCVTVPIDNHEKKNEHERAEKGAKWCHWWYIFRRSYHSTRYEKLIIKKVINKRLRVN